jgi:cyclic pyranopterin phosphate synthase
MAELTHVDGDSKVRMVDVGDKNDSRRRAIAAAELVVGKGVIEAVRSRATPKGDVLATARIAGIMAAKRTSELVPLCHPLPIDHVAVDFRIGSDRISIEATVASRAATGVEMEALTAVTVAGLTLYDMLKALSKDMVLGDVHLVEKSGGRSGTYHAPDRTTRDDDP